MAPKWDLTPLRGIIPPMVTPLIEQDRLDVEGLPRLIEHILAGEVHGLFILGTTGEAPSLSHELRRELIQRTCREVDGRVPVLVGITDTSFSESVSIARLAADAGASAVVLAPPYYFPADQPELLEYLTHMAVQVPLPMFLYNMPSHTKLIYEPDTVRKAADIAGIVGLKDSSGNMFYFHQLQLLLEDRTDFSLLVGPEGLLAEALLQGGHGGVAGGANIFPRLYVDLYNAAVSRDLEAVLDMHRKIMRIYATLYSVGQHNSSFMKGVKCVLSCKGICSDFMAEPFHRFGTNERAQVEAYIDELELD